MILYELLRIQKFRKKNLVNQMDMSILMLAKKKMQLTNTSIFQPHDPKIRPATFHYNQSKEKKK